MREPKRGNLARHRLRPDGDWEVTWRKDTGEIVYKTVPLEEALQMLEEIDEVVRMFEDVEEQIRQAVREGTLTREQLLAAEINPERLEELLGK